jgi:hypothetical protein
MSARRTPPPAILSGPLTAGRIVEPACPRPVNLARHGYVEEEYVASGTARAYQGEDLEADGSWVVSSCATAPYRTRVVVRRPAERRFFSGTVLVEWLNVSGGVEAAPDWAYLHQEILRRGHGYVAVSAQAFGVSGGTALLATPGVAPHGGLVAAQPARYGTLVHPGDRFSFDLFSQVGAALRLGRHPPALGPLRPTSMVAMGESQSAFFLTTYVNAVHHDSEVYDGFLVHSRGGDAASPSGIPRGDPAVPGGVRIRTDVRVPVLTLETETDLGPRLDYARARQPDTERIRTWEVAGTAHADAYLVGSFVDMLGCGVAVNDGPHHVVALAALRALERWVAEGTSPPVAPPLQLASLSPPVIARDGLGNALGGVRTPAVDVPVATLSGDPPEGASELCSLFGSTVPFDATTLKSLYRDKHAYRSAHEAALDAAITAGFLLDDDRETLRARAEEVAFLD